MVTERAATELAGLIDPHDIKGSLERVYALTGEPEAAAPKVGRHGIRDVPGYIRMNIWWAEEWLRPDSPYEVRAPDAQERAKANELLSHLGGSHVFPNRTAKTIGTEADAVIGRLQHHITGRLAEVAAKVDDPEALRHFYAIGDPWTSGTVVSIVQDPEHRLAVEYHFGMLSRDPNPAERAYADALVQAIADAAREERATWEAGWEQARIAVWEAPEPALTETGEPDLLAGLDTPEAMPQLAADLDGPFGTVTSAGD